MGRAYGPIRRGDVQQLRCRMAGLRGDGTDEAIVEPVADLIYKSSDLRRDKRALTQAVHRP